MTIPACPLCNKQLQSPDEFDLLQQRTMAYACYSEDHKYALYNDRSNRLHYGGYLLVRRPNDKSYPSDIFNKNTGRFVKRYDTYPSDEQVKHDMEMVVLLG